MDKNKNIRKVKESGITLIALVVTIIVILILVGITMRAVTDNGGLIKKANKAKADYKQSEQNDTRSMDSYTTYMENSKYISFKVENTECTAERGMTWAEWVNSDYNTIGARIEYTRYIYASGGGVRYKNESVELEDRIIENMNYGIARK